MKRSPTALCNLGPGIANSLERFASRPTTSIPGLYPPTSSTSVVVVYQSTVQRCGADLDAAAQSALQAYNAAGIAIQNATSTTDPGFLQWSPNYIPLVNARNTYGDTENTLFRAEDLATTSPPATSSKIASSAVTTSVTATMTSSGSHSSAFTSIPLFSGCNRAVGTRTRSSIIYFGMILAVMLVGLNEQ
ncbi:hypothetical protein B0H17DRAFT_1145555 [Mycena rosella]|uniref:Uncharacterized protein n=1 Tax=Mycena rosella TaxID=1033263 RepID=A0AAD7G5S2_MYCRO|nr:hypothetical protein B0H17DRAFT_1145555 [Mycena rosella]